ncbi:hypothetical protein KKA85_00790 [bacterium]|nr:hypothetical protein [bacterium]MBU1674295.1 hypothetical protein [bacterium]
MRLLILCVGLLMSAVLVAGPAHAQPGCDIVVPIDCDGPVTNYPVGFGGYPGGSLVCGYPFSVCGGTVFEVTLSATQQITMHLVIPYAAATYLFLFEDCLGTHCIDYIQVTQSETDWSVCLPAGTYYIGMLEQTCVFYYYDLSVSCVDCSDPIANVSGAWGAVKAIYR